VKAGKKAEAIRNLDQLLEFSKHGYMVAVQRASVYVGLGNAEKAFEWLDKGYNEHNTQLSYLKIDPVWQSLRSDARYAALLKKIGLEK
jgi:predicted Zn-dependent protease